MAQNLALIFFNKNANRAFSRQGWQIGLGDSVDTLAGDDQVIATNNYNGLVFYGEINTGSGDDKITGRCNEGYGIFNYRKIITGGGNDLITGIAGTEGIYNLGVIDTGRGNDIIKGVGRYDGIYNDGGTINTGRGHDTIVSIGDIDQGLYNSGTINTGPGNDKIIGKGNKFRNEGTIITGAGNDIVDALIDGFSGDGTTDLGSGRDTIKGFGTGTFNGGTGRDKLVFGEGTYIVSGSTVKQGGFFITTMNVFEFEKIGGANGGLFNFRNGTLTVNSEGVATFAA